MDQVMAPGRCEDADAMVVRQQKGGKEQRRKNKKGKRLSEPSRGNCAGGSYLYTYTDPGVWKLCRSSYPAPMFRHDNTMVNLGQVFFDFVITNPPNFFGALAPATAALLGEPVQSRSFWGARGGVQRSHCWTLYHFVCGKFHPQTGGGGNPLIQAFTGNHQMEKVLPVSKQAPPPHAPSKCVVTEGTEHG